MAEKTLEVGADQQKILRYWTKYAKVLLMKLFNIIYVSGCV